MGFPGGAVVKNPPVNAGDVRDVGEASEGKSPNSSLSAQAFLRLLPCKALLLLFRAHSRHLFVSRPITAQNYI